MKKGLVLFAIAIGGLGLVVWQLQSGPEGPQAVSWDQATCAHCQMHVGDPRFAAQLQTRDGRVENFDDHGCLFEYVAERDSKVAAVYFRHYRRDGWVSRRRVRFVEIDEPTPMGYGLAAVAAEDAPEAKTYREALQVITSSKTAPDERRDRHDKEAER